MCTALELLEHQVLPELRSGDPELAALYSPAGRLVHYARLARTLDAQIADSDLTVAAFLHGVPLARARTLPGVSAGALAILEDWHALRRVAPSTSPAASSAFQGDVRALALAVYDCLQRLDPDGDLRRWSRGFHLNPSRPDWELPPARPEDEGFLQRAALVVAPLARAWGFWTEGNALLDAVLYLRDRARFSEVMEFVAAEGLTDRSWPRHLEAVRAALSGERLRHELRWEWRHLESISANLDGIGRSDWRKALFRCGFVTLLVDERSAYPLLGRLHEACDYRPQDIRDYLGKATPGGYQALHTRLLFPDEKQGTLTVSVRIVTTADSELRFALADADHLTRLQARKSPVRSTIRLYTPTGDIKELPPRSTVLNFACAVHADFAALATHATVNRDREVGLLHVLDDGDEVNVVAGETPRPLPKGWEQAVPPNTRDRIRTAWQKAWKAALAAEGDRWLRKHLALPAGDPQVVQVLVELAAEEIADEHRDGRHSGSWWLTQLALHFGSLQVPKDAATVHLDARRAADRLARVEEKTRALLRVSERAEIQAPAELRGKVRRIRLCPTCRPGRSRNLVATTVPQDGGVELVLHRPDEPCAHAGLPLVLRDRVALEQFFVVETNNKVGVALKILAVFEDEGIDLVEVTGRRLGPDWGVFRIEVEPIGPRTIRHVRRRLLALENVHSVRTPMEAGSAVLEAALPPRSDNLRNPLTRPQPFICGPTAVDDQHFYGRDDEIGLLFDLLRRVRGKDSGRGLMCHVRGPLRIGKSSLVLRFQLLLRRRPDLGAIPVYVKTEVGEPWSRIRQRMERELARELAEAWRAWGEAGPPPQGQNLEETLRLLARHPRRPSVVLAVDEVNRLFGTSGQNSDELRELLRFRDLVDTTPGVLALWIGPAAGVGTLKREIRDLLVASQPLVVRPFTFEQAMAMLEARKLALFHTIAIDQNLGRRLFRLTGGEPFWLGHLAQAMWTLRQNTASRVVRFDHAVADAACRELMERHELFAVRVEPRTRVKREEVAWTVAALLARDAPEAGDRGLSAADVAQRLAMDEQRAANLLETLKDRGALHVHEGEPRRWCIAFPLLAAYLNLHRKNLLPVEAAHA